jgi:predicted Ser/Thr protein kinase
MYCFNLQCGHPSGTMEDEFCRSCGAPMLLKNRYRAISELGTGSFGRTLLAVDLDGRKVAVKQRRRYEGLPGEDFGYEAEILRKLNEGAGHPQIPALLEEILDESTSTHSGHYLVLEYVEGPSLEEVFADHHPWLEQEVRRFIESLLPVVHFIHEKGVLHRDIKPKNILFRADGTPCLIDFGNAQYLAPATSRHGYGTRGFMAPEWSVEGRVYRASDLFAVGSLALFLLGADRDTIRRERPWLWRNWRVKMIGPWFRRRCRVRVTASFGTWLDGLVAQRPTERFPTAKAALAALHVGGVARKGQASMSDHLRGLQYWVSDWQGPIIAVEILLIIGLGSFVIMKRMDQPPSSYLPNESRIEHTA